MFVFERLLNDINETLKFAHVELNEFHELFIENMLYTLHATYIKHNLYANFSLKLERLLREFSCNRFTVQNEQKFSLLKFQQFTSVKSQHKASHMNVI